MSRTSGPRVGRGRCDSPASAPVPSAALVRSSGAAARAPPSSGAAVSGAAALAGGVTAVEVRRRARAARRPRRSSRPRRACPRRRGSAGRPAPCPRSRAGSGSRSSSMSPSGLLPMPPLANPCRCERRSLSPAAPFTPEPLNTRTRIVSDRASGRFCCRRSRATSSRRRARILVGLRLFGLRAPTRASN